jgi:hypothetical protein
VSGRQAVKVSVHFSGGVRFKELMAKAISPARINAYKVGWPTDSMYTPDGGEPISTAAVAEIQEFGNHGNPVGRGAVIPERPFFRMADEKFNVFLRQFVRLAVRRNMKLDYKDVHFMADKHVQYVRQSIVEFDSPGNSPATIARKGEDNPLVETGQMAQDVSYEVTKR